MDWLNLNTLIPAGWSPTCKSSFFPQKQNNNISTHSRVDAKYELFTSFLIIVDKPVFGCKKLLSLRTSFFKPLLIFSWGFAQRKQSQKIWTFTRSASNISGNSKTCPLACILLTKQKHNRHLIGPKVVFLCGKKLIFGFSLFFQFSEISFLLLFQFWEGLKNNIFSFEKVSLNKRNEET